MTMRRRIYLDHAAATNIDSGVVRALRNSFQMVGNPNSVHKEGRDARNAIERAERSILDFFSAKTHMMLWSFSVTNLITEIFRDAIDLFNGPREVITTSIEYRAILESCAVLKKRGWNINRLSVNKDGFISVSDITKKITSKTTIVAIGHSNSEIGTIQPIKEIGKIIQEYRRKNKSVYPLFLIDASQSVEWVPIDVQAWGVDVLAFCSSKIYGIPGVATALIRRGILPSQKNAEMYSTPLIISTAEAVSKIDFKDSNRISSLRDETIGWILKTIPGARLNGPSGLLRISNNINISFSGCPSDELMLALDKRGVAVGSGSACTSHRVGPSHVLEAIKPPKEFLDTAIRISLSRSTTKQELKLFIKILKEEVDRVRKR